MANSAQDLTHIADNFLSGVGYSMVALTGFRSLRHRIALRPLVRSAAVFFLFRAAVNAYSALQTEYHWSRWPSLILYGLAGVAAVVFGAQMLASQDDIDAVLRTADEENRIERDHQRDIEMARMATEYQALIELQRASAILVSAQAQANRGEA